MIPTLPSFLMGGYECADHINRSGERINLLKYTEHDRRAAQDFTDLAALSIRVAREGVCWSAVETAPYQFDFSEVAHRLRAAHAAGIEVLWDLCHFGYPDGLIPTHPQFVPRFVALCRAFAVFHRQVTDAQLYVVPINEISFLAWHSGDVRGTVPFATNSGWDIKWHLCRAAIQGIQALREVDPRCRILTIEPLIRVHGHGDSDFGHIARMNNDQFQAMDIIGGRMCPELGGREEYLDLLGFNYYYNGQWRDGVVPLPWPEPEGEARRVPLHQLLLQAHLRYRRPFFLSETGHFGEGRVPWLEEIAGEVEQVLAATDDFFGVCIYPVLDRPDWDDLTSYSNCGLWDLDAENNRIPHVPSIELVQQLRHAWSPVRAL